MTQTFSTPGLKKKSPLAWIFCRKRVAVDLANCPTAFLAFCLAGCKITYSFHVNWRQWREQSLQRRRTHKLTDSTHTRTHKPSPPITPAHCLHRFFPTVWQAGACAAAGYLSIQWHLFSISISPLIFSLTLTPLFLFLFFTKAHLST